MASLWYDFSRSSMDIKNLYQSIPINLSDEFFQVLAQSDQVKIERIISRGHSSPPNDWYDQDTHEWVVLLRGAAQLVFEKDGIVTMKPGDYILIPAHTRHRVDWTDPDSDTVWLAVHYI